MKRGIRLDGAEIVRRRRQNSWTQRELADEVGIGRSTLQRAEAGEPIDPQMPKWLAKALNCEVKDLLNKEVPYVTEPQRVRWAPVDGGPPGISIVGDPGHFVSWPRLKKEIEERLLPQIRNIPVGSTVSLQSFRGRTNWVVRITDPNANEVGDVWFGPDPKNKWSYDGLVRVGGTDSRGRLVVWQVFQRYSDGIYRRIAVESG
jgi:transcriptional regulator with XRE-family HTH domain